MLALLKSDAEFSPGCALPMIARSFLLTHLLTIREVTLANASHIKDERGR
jgi:hypothetical protein